MESVQKRCNLGVITGSFQGVTGGDLEKGFLMFFDLEALRRIRYERQQERKQWHAKKKKDRPKCGAKTRKGTPCLAPPVWDTYYDRPENGRCRMHGGLSTGPSLEGIERISEANRQRARARRLEQAGRV